MNTSQKGGDALRQGNKGRYGLFKAKFHYASWFEAGSKHVRSWSPTSFEADSVMEFGFEHVCDQLRISFEAASVMEFGFYR